MRHGSLFSGIGGFDLAAEWMGWKNIFHCEWNKFCQAVLKYHFPNSISYDDITKTDFTIHRGSIDILTGGFPCQPYSTAGKRLGKEDDRHLFPEMLRAIREIQPLWVVAENVRGLVSWNGGMVFDQVQFDLEVEGYEVIPFILPACAVNAPHRRDRVWFIAKKINASGVSNSHTQSEQGESGKLKQRKVSEQKQGQLGRVCSKTITNNTSSIRQPTQEHGQEGSGEFAGYGIQDYWKNFPTQSFVRGGDDGLSDILDADTVLKATGGRKAESNWINESIKAYGNAVVPQLVYQIFRAIKND